MMCAWTFSGNELEEKEGPLFERKEGERGKQ
jgi:hypothetical protein